MAAVKNNQGESLVWYKKWWVITLLIILGLFLIISSTFIFYVLALAKQINLNQVNLNFSNNQLQPNDLKKITGENNYWLGAAQPKVTIVEFGDFACSLCKQSFSKIREISIKYKEDVKIIYRDFPVIAEYSPDLASAARCAGEQGLFWPMYDKLFINQGISKTEELINLAKQISASTTKFQTCLENKKYLANIGTDYTDGNELGVKGTPTWFINGYKIEGDIPYDTFINIIEELIKS